MRLERAAELLEPSHRAPQFTENFFALRSTNAEGQVCDTHADVTLLFAVHHMNFAWVDYLFFTWDVQSEETASACVAKLATSLPLSRCASLTAIWERTWRR